MNRVRSDWRLFVAALAAAVTFCLLPSAAQANFGPNASWSPNVAVGDNGNAPEGVISEQMSDGSAILVWKRDIAGEQRIQAMRLDAAGEAGPVLTLSPAGADATEPVVALNPEGEATVGWLRSDGTVDVVQTVKVSTDNTVGTVADRSATGPAGHDAVGPRVAYAGNGDLGVTWRKFNGTDWIVQLVIVRHIDDPSVPSTGWSTEIRDLNPINDNIRPLYPMGRPDVFGDAGGLFTFSWAEGGADLHNIGSIALSFPATAAPPAKPEIEVISEYDALGHIGPGMRVDYSYTYVRAVPTPQDDPNVPKVPITDLPMLPRGVGGDPQQVQLALDGGGAPRIFWLRHVTGAVNDVPATRWAYETAVFASDAVTRMTPLTYDASELFLTSNVGRLRAAWVASNGGDRWIESGRVNGNGVAAGRRDISGPVGADGGAPSARVSSRGWEYVAWQKDEGGSDTSAQVFQLAPNGLFDGPTKISVSPLESASYPNVVIPPSGDAQALFSGVDNTSNGTIWSTRFTDPQARFAPGALNFGSVMLGIDSTPRTAYITNPGATSSQVTGVHISGPDANQYSIVPAGACLGELVGEGVCQIRVRLRPSSVGAKQATLNVETNVGNFSAALNGRGIDRTRLRMTVTPAKREVNNRKARRQFRVNIENLGSVTANNARVCLTSKRRFVRGSMKCRNLGSIAGNATRSFTFRARLTNKAKRGRNYRLRVRVSAGKASPQTASGVMRWLTKKEIRERRQAG